MTDYVRRYFAPSGPDFEGFWKEYLKTERRIMFVTGLGFDPRSFDCLKKIIACNTKSTIDYRIVEYDYFIQNGKMRDMYENNRNELEEMGLPQASKQPIRMQGDENMTSTDAIRSVTGEDLCTHSDIVVDVTSMPVGAYFPMIKSILSMIKRSADPKVRKTNLHITVSENPRMDASIQETTKNEKSAHMHRFSQSLEKETMRGVPKVWIPVLGANQKDQFGKIKSQITPAETIPVLPMPSSDPYESRDILLEYSALFDDLQIEQRNVAYSDEQNPSETCAKIMAIARDYDRLCATMRRCVVVISPLANKLRCIGCLMAACDLLDEGIDLAVAYVPNQSYSIKDTFTKSPSTLCTIWLAGECYE